MSSQPSISREKGCGAERPSAPLAPRRPNLVGVVNGGRADDWQWLRDGSSPEVQSYLAAEVAYTAESLRRSDHLRSVVLAEIAARIGVTSASAPIRKGNWEYYVRAVENQPYGVHCRRPAGIPGEPDPDATPGEPSGEEVFLDENQLARGQAHFRLILMALSPGQMRIAYLADHTGGERLTIRFRDLETGADLADEIVDASPYGAWLDEDSFVYVSRNRRGRDWQVCCHRLGSAGDDPVIFEEHDDRVRLALERARTGRYIVIKGVTVRSNEIRLVDVDEPLRAPRLIAERVAGVEHCLEHHVDEQGHGRLFLATTFEDLGGDRLLVADDDHDPMVWHEVISVEDGRRLGQYLAAFKEHLVFSERGGDLDVLRVMPLAELGPEQAGKILSPPPGAEEVWLGRNLEFDAATVRARCSSHVAPTMDIDYDLETGDGTIVRRDRIDGYDPSAYEAFTDFASAADGTRIPISIVRPKGLHEPAPMVLYGYGAYGMSVPRRFEPARLSLLERGAGYAIAHVRGGGELGRRWHDEGRRLQKSTSINDFVACAEHLISTGHADRLVASGGSAGGLLVAGAANIAPHLFKAVVAEMPFVDCLSVLLDPEAPMTTMEWEEWGDPRSDDAVRRAIEDYSPYENVTSQHYPSMLVTTALNDSRVEYWQALKWVAKLRALSLGDPEIYLHVEREAGHMGPSGRKQAQGKVALVLAFIIEQLCIGGDDSGVVA